MSFIFRKHKKDASVAQGFSFIEIIVVIAIMGILMTLVVPRLFQFVGRAKKLKTTTSLKAIKNVIMQFHIDVGQYPNTLTDLVAKPASPALAQLWQGPYLEEKDIESDGWNNEFMYRKNAPGSKRPYDLYSWGPQGEGSPEDEWIDVWAI